MTVTSSEPPCTPQRDPDSTADNARHQKLDLELHYKLVIPTHSNAMVSAAAEEKHLGLCRRHEPLMPTYWNADVVQ